MNLRSLEIPSSLERTNLATKMIKDLKAEYTLLKSADFDHHLIDRMLSDLESVKKIIMFGEKRDGVPNMNHVSSTDPMVKITSYKKDHLTFGKH